MHSWHFTLECFAKIQNPSRTISDFCTKSVLFIASVHDVKTSEVSKAEIYSNHKSADRQGQLRYQFNFFSMFPSQFPRRCGASKSARRKQIRTSSTSTRSRMTTTCGGTRRRSPISTSRPTSLRRFRAKFATSRT